MQSHLSLIYFEIVNNVGRIRYAIRQVAIVGWRALPDLLNLVNNKKYGFQNSLGLLILFLLLSGIAPALFAAQIELKTGLKAEPKTALAIKPPVKPPAVPQPQKTQEEKTTKPVFKSVRVAPYTYLYAEAGAKKRGQLKQGVRLKVIGLATAADGKRWNKIEFEGRVGYVKSSHLQDVD